jgi:hypothetical protein
MRRVTGARLEIIPVTGKLSKKPMWAVWDVQTKQYIDSCATEEDARALKAKVMRHWAHERNA